MGAALFTENGDARTLNKFCIEWVGPACLIYHWIKLLFFETKGSWLCPIWCGVSRNHRRMKIGNSLIPSSINNAQTSRPSVASTKAGSQCKKGGRSRAQQNRLKTGWARPHGSEVYEKKRNGTKSIFTDWSIMDSPMSIRYSRMTTRDSAFSNNLH